MSTIPFFQAILGSVTPEKERFSFLRVCENYLSPFTSKRAIIVLSKLNPELLKIKFPNFASLQGLAPLLLKDKINDAAFQNIKEAIKLINESLTEA